MGRHSAPDDDALNALDTTSSTAGGTAVATAVAEVEAPERHGRHSRPEDLPGDRPDTSDAEESDGGLLADLIIGFGGDENPPADRAAAATAEPPTVEPPTVDAAVMAPPAHVAPAPGAGSPSPAKAAGGSRSDLRLLREHGDVRARVIAGVLVPFAIFTVVMAVLGRLDRSYLLWIWLPLVTAGVLGGLFLDLGHRRYRAVPAPDADHVAEVAPER